MMPPLLSRIEALERELETIGADPLPTFQKRVIAGRALAFQLEAESDVHDLAEKLRACLDTLPNSNPAHLLLEEVEEAFEVERSAGFLVIEALEAACPAPGGPILQPVIDAARRRDRRFRAG